MYISKIKTFLICLILISIIFTGSLTAGTEKNKSAMLAKNWMPKINIDGWWLSEKLDGVRGCWNGSEMLSRSGKKINAPEWFTKNFPPFALDGELWIGRGEFSELVSVVRTENENERWRKVGYYIFDVPVKGITFEERIEKAKKWFENNPSSYAEILLQKVCKDKLQLAKELELVEKMQGEGVMLRRPGSFFKNGRSGDILKVKTFHDAEAVVVAHVKGKGRNSKRMGSIIVELENGKRFRIGTGFTDNERENPPPKGSHITFKYKEINKSGIPRFASFVRVRESF